MHGDVVYAKKHVVFVISFMYFLQLMISFMYLPEDRGEHKT